MVSALLKVQNQMVRAAVQNDMKNLMFTFFLGSTLFDVLLPLPFVTAVFRLVQVAVWLYCNVFFCLGVCAASTGHQGRQ